MPGGIQDGKIADARMSDYSGLILTGGPGASALVDNAEAQRLILGGPMMGFALPHDGVPITKVANCFLVASAEEAPPAAPAAE